MPVTVRRQGGKYRIVDPDSGKVEMTPQGHPRDGGGHSTREEALRQMRAMNMAHEKKERGSGKSASALPKSFSFARFKKLFRL